MVKCEDWKEERYTAMCMAMGGGGGLFFPTKQLGEGREQGNKNTSANKGYIERWSTQK